MSDLFTFYILFYDVESTGKVPTEDDIISFGAVLTVFQECVGFRKLDEFHEFVHTKRPIDPDAQTVHHISEKMIENAVDFPGMIVIFKAWLGKYLLKPSDRLILMAHNGSKFDDVMLCCNFIAHQMCFEEFLTSIHCSGFIDSLKMIKKLFQTCLTNRTLNLEQVPKVQDTGRISYALGTCHECFCGEPIGEFAHNALVDSVALYKIFTSEKSRQLLCQFRLSKLFEFIVPCEKSVEALKRTAGLERQHRMEQIRQMEIGDFEEEEYKFSTLTEEAWGKITELPATPIWAPTNHTNTKRLCLNCMCFVEMMSHQQCDLRSQNI